MSFSKRSAASLLLFFFFFSLCAPFAGPTIFATAQGTVTPAPMVAVYDAAQESYIVNPSTSSSSSNTISRPQLVCSVVDAVRYYISSAPVSLTHDISSSHFGARIGCLSSVVTRGYGASATCMQSASISTTIQIINVSSPDVAIMEFDAEQIFNLSSISAIQIVSPSLVTVRVRTSVQGTTCSSLDVLYMYDVTSVASQPAAALATVPTVANLYEGLGSGPWLGNRSAAAANDSTATLRLVRSLGAPARNRFKLVLVPIAVDCNASLVLQSTKIDSPTPFTAEYSEPAAPTNVNINLKVRLTRPSVPGLYTLCCGEDEATMLNATSATSMMDISTIRVLDVQSPVFVTTPSEWQRSSVTPPVVPATSWEFYFDGLAGDLSATLDAVALVLGDAAGVNCSNVTSHAFRSNTSMPLEDVVPGRVRWVVPATVLSSAGATYINTPVTFCYLAAQRAQSTWSSIPFYHALTAFTTRVSLAPYISADPLTNSPMVSTTAQPTTTTQPVSTTPAPTIRGGCMATSRNASAAFGTNGGVRFQTTGPWSVQFFEAFSSMLSTQLCVAEVDMPMFQFRLNSQWFVQVAVTTRVAVVDVGGTSFGPYLGTLRMAALLYDVYPARASTYQSMFFIQSAAAAAKIDASQATGDESPVAQLVVGVAVAGLVCVLICLCGVTYMCCKKVRQRIRGRREPNIVGHVPIEEATVIPRAMVIEARARVVVARRAPRAPGEAASSNSDGESDVSTVDGTLVDRDTRPERGRGARAAEEEEMIEVVDPSVYGQHNNSGEACRIGYSQPGPPMILGKPRGTRAPNPAPDVPVVPSDKKTAPNVDNPQEGSLEQPIHRLENPLDSPPSAREAPAFTTLPDEHEERSTTPSTAHHRVQRAGLTTIVVGTPPLRTQNAEIE